MTDYIEDICINGGGKVYIVGGFIRNKLFNYFHNKNLPIKDLDLLVCNVTIDDLIKILQKYDTVKTVGINFSVIKFKKSNTDSEIDIALPRTEISLDNTYKGFKIITDHICL